MVKGYSETKYLLLFHISGGKLNVDSMISYFVDEQSKLKVYLFLDTPHMLKLFRNTLGEMGIIVPGFPNPATWSEFKMLYECIQEEGGIRLGNTITINHVHYTRHKMKVKYAAQILSRSTGNFLTFLRVDNGDIRFANSAATTYICHRVDEGFDILNSRNREAKGIKAPITKKNLEEKKDALNDFGDFLKSLKLASGTLISKSPRKTCIIGFCPTIMSTIGLAMEMLTREENPYEVFYTYFCQQDFLEHFFSRVRQRCGENNNPDHVQVSPNSMPYYVVY